MLPRLADCAINRSIFQDGNPISLVQNMTSLDCGFKGLSFKDSNFGATSHGSFRTLVHKMDSKAEGGMEMCSDKLLPQ
jgi:hypothetical protein